MRLLSKNIEHARRIAQGNANQTRVSWIIFTDTSGVLNVERMRNSEYTICGGYEIVQPQVRRDTDE